MSRTWSSDSPNVQVGLDRVQQYMLFFLFQNKDSLVPQMGNVIAIGLTPSRTGIVIGPSRTGIVIGPSRTGIVIGPSRTGIVIGRLLNAQLRHMSVRAAWRLKLSLFWPQTRCRQVALYSLVVQSSLEFSLSLSFAFKYLINARAHFAFTFISGHLLIYNLQRHIFCNKHGTLINKTNKNTPLPCYKPNIKLQTCKMFKCKKQQLTIIKRCGTK